MAATATKKEIMFVYEGKDKKGTKKTGELTGASEAAVKAVLRKQGILPIKVKKKPKSWGMGGKPIETADIALFARQMATMMTSGVPLLQSFDLVGQGHDKPAFQKLVMEIKSKVEAGGTMADALREHPQYFDSLFCNLVEAGEQAGILESLLTKLAIYKEKSEAIKKKVKGALSYPISIMVVAMIVSAILLIYVVPVFADMFKSFGGQLPGLTQMVVNMSDFLVANYHWAEIGGGLFGAKIAFGQAKQRSVKFQHFLQRLSLKLPMFGELLTKSALARFTRTLATMFAAGTPLVEAMDSVAGATGNIVFYEATMKIKEEVMTGTTLAESMRNTGVFPNMCVQMTQIGEESGSIDKMLNKVADYYEEEVDALVESLSAMMEPMIMAFLGVVIGGLVLAMYLPIFKMGGEI
ncbi:type IV fimbrial assembly protein pilC [Thioploca ingrica]|uniref:Type IV fimbrial assembly protein pilC n=1 Tax=Thioploca ingrica TaxID=40754 RepID=A0A090BV57_9GAMM|nr:type IV fimbrial assembly protein pilC [Thioploca ingrica]